MKSELVTCDQCGKQHESRGEDQFPMFTLLPPADSKVLKVLPRRRRWHQKDIDLCSWRCVQLYAALKMKSPTTRNRQPATHK